MFLAAEGLEDHQGPVRERSARTAASEAGCEGVDWSDVFVGGLEGWPEKRLGSV